MIFAAIALTGLWLIVTLSAAVLAWLTAAHLPGERGYPLLGFAVGVGWVIHLFGDMITKSRLRGLREDPYAASV